MASLQQITRASELRTDDQQRRRDGSYYTDSDVARHLARRAISAWMLEQLGASMDAVAALLADGADLPAALAAHATDTVDAAAALTRMRVLDPTCGAGSFLVAAWDAIVEVEELLELGPVAHAQQLIGIDLDAQAVDACRLTLGAQVPAARGAADIRCADALSVDPLPVADILLGNPPYVRAASSEAPAGLTTSMVPNRSAWIVERAMEAAASGARASFVLPISTACTDAFQPARDHWSARCAVVHASHFDAIPSSLFAGVVQRLTILEGRVRAAADDRAGQWFTTRYHRWRSSERAGLLAEIRHVPMPPQHVAGSIAKVGTRVERELLELLFRHRPAARLLEGRGRGEGSNRFFYKRRWSYFLLFADFVPPIWDAQGAQREPTEFKPVDVVAPLDARVLLAIYSSTLFWWYFSVFTDNRNVNRRDLAAFPVPELDGTQQQRLVALADELMAALRACAEVRTCTYRSIGTIRNTYFRQAATRPVLDRIDQMLADAYSMDDRHLAFVLDYERRFRGGGMDDSHAAIRTDQ